MENRLKRMQIIKKAVLCGALLIGLMLLGQNIEVQAAADIGYGQVYGTAINTHKKSRAQLSLNQTKITIYAGKKYQLHAKAKGVKGRKVWSSSNKKVASVNQKGKVTAKKAGKAKITVRVKKLRKVCRVTVKRISLVLDKTSVTMGVGQKEKVSAHTDGPSSKITWSTSDKNIVRVSDSGKITALKAGKATIKVRANGSVKKITVTVIATDIKDYLTEGAGGEETVAEMKKLAKAIGGMKAASKEKYPDAYYAGNQMVIGVNNHPVYGTVNDEYIRIENNGNKGVLFYGVAIGCTKQQMEEKFEAYSIVSYDDGKSYSNANAWSVSPTFENGKLVKYIYLCRPTSGGSSTQPTEVTEYSDMKGKSFSYKNEEYLYGIGFGNTGKVYIGVWDPTGTSSSYEDFWFEIKEGIYDYSEKGMRSGYTYDIRLVPYDSEVEVSIFCNDRSYTYFDIDQTFYPTDNGQPVLLADR